MYIALLLVLILINKSTISLIIYKKKSSHLKYLYKKMIDNNLMKDGLENLSLSSTSTSLSLSLSSSSSSSSSSILKTDLNNDKIDNVSILIITSPSPSNPDLDMLHIVIGSFENLYGLEDAPILILLDGYIINSTNRTKKGKVTSSLASNYEQYYLNLQDYYKDNPRITIIKSPTHLGFAMAVQYGLQQCNTTYCLVCQHDRQFIKKFNGIKKLINCMETNEHIRYIGFPTSCNRTYRRLLYSRYPGISILNDKNFIPLDNNIGLQPLIFWFDSQHLCHVQRYLQIFKPYTNLPQELRDLFGLKVIRSMVLKKGDFIEDRFGQLQRNILMSFGNKTINDNDINKYCNNNDDNDNNDNDNNLEVDNDNDTDDESNDKNTNIIEKSNKFININNDVPYDEDLLLRIFKWFGTYLIWIPEADEHATIIVQHMKGRQRLISHLRSLAPIEYT